MSDDGRTDAPAVRMIYDIKRHVKQVRFRFIDEYRDCRLTTSTKRDLASAALKYWDVLHEYRAETVLDEEDLPNIAPIRNRLGKQTEIQTRSKRLGQRTTTKLVPAVDGLDPEFVIEVTHELDDLANKLGFTAQPSPNTTHRTEIDSDLMKEVEEWRKQKLDN